MSARTPVRVRCACSPNGRRRGMPGCEDCGGYGWTVPTAATDALTRLVGDRMVALLDDHAEQVVAWLHEIGVLRDTKYALKSTHTAHLGDWHPDYRPPGSTTVEEWRQDMPTPPWRRLYTVEVES